MLTSRDGRLVTSPEANDALDGLYYNGDTRHYNFGTHTSNMEEQFLTLEQYDRPMAEDDKVRKLLTSIRTTDPVLLAGVAHVRANAELKRDYFAAKTYLAGCITPLKKKDRRQVSFAGTTPKGKVDYKKSYSNDEWWNTLTQEQRDEITRLRKENKSKAKNGKKKAEKRKRNQEKKAQKRAIAAAKAEILKEQAKGDESAGSDSDDDVYLRAAARDNGEQYYEYVCCFVDDCLAFSANPAKIMEALWKIYKLKPVQGSDVPWEEPKRYLGADVGKYNLSGETAWYMSSDSYVKLAIKTIEEKLRKHDQCLSKKAEGPIQAAYRPELDVSPLLDDERANFYQELVGVLNWIVELGRIDIHTAVSKMSAYLAAPRKGHLAQVLHIFAYLKKYDRSKTVLNPEYVDHDERSIWWALTFGIYPEMGPWLRHWSIVLSARLCALGNQVRSSQN